MSCYFRHLKSVFDEAGIEATPDNKKKVDQLIHESVGVAYKDCPTAWKAVKQQVLEDDSKREALVKKLREASL